MVGLLVDNKIVGWLRCLFVCFLFVCSFVPLFVCWFRRFVGLSVRWFVGSWSVPFFVCVRLPVCNCLFDGTLGCCGKRFFCSHSSTNGSKTAVFVLIKRFALQVSKLFGT